MTYHGRVRNGVIVLEDDTPLPEGTEVRVEPVADGQAAPEADRSPLADSLLKFAGTIDDLPPDASRNIDHYLYGRPER